MKNYLIKTVDNQIIPVKQDYFINRLKRQTELNVIADTKVMQSLNLKDCLNGYVKQVKAITFDPDSTDIAILSSITDNKGFYLIERYNEERAKFYTSVFNN